MQETSLISEANETARFDNGPQIMINRSTEKAVQQTECSCCDIGAPNQRPSRESGFSLIEVLMALVVISVALLGMFSVFTYAILYNTGNKNRAASLAVLQDQIEQIRAAKFNETTTDLVLQGHDTTRQTVTNATGLTFTVDTTVDNEPNVAGVQDETYQCLTPQAAVIPCAIKEVTITVRLAAPSPAWQTAVPATAILRRVRAN
jgi:prepilin-type N-terminal cleavage/methylation domain-containing protein